MIAFVAAFLLCARGLQAWTSVRLRFNLDHRNPPWRWSIGGERVAFRSQSKLLMTTPTNDDSGDNEIDEDYTDDSNTGLDMFGEPLLQDAETLLKLRRQKRLDNDKWQSRLFQREQGGRWSGSYEVFKPRLIPVGDIMEPSLVRAQSGLVNTIATASKYDPTTGVDISIVEDYSVTFTAEDSNKGSNTAVDTGANSSDNKATLEALLTPDNSEAKYTSCDFRTARGNQAVGNAYTLCQLVPPLAAPTAEELIGDIPATEPHDAFDSESLRAYAGEVGIREGDFRIRVRYVYRRNTDADSSGSNALRPEEASTYDFSLFGVTVVRETFIGPTAEPVPNSALSAEASNRMSSNEGGFVPSAGSMGLKDQEMGLSIYDPQESGEPYVELPLPGSLTLFFPRGLRYNYESTGTQYGVVAIQWLGEQMRYQVDRKFNTLRGGAITTLELTEIGIDDSLTDYADPLFNPSPSLLK